MKSPTLASPLFHDTFPTPAGEFSLAVNARGAIAAAVFGGLDALRECLGLREGQPGPARDPVAVARLRRHVEEYFAGDRRPFAFDLAVSPTPFQGKVWALLRDIPRGETRSYGQLAASLGSPRAARAVGRAVGSNPVCLFVPCHRVIGANGSLTGYAYGEEIKRTLLAIERDLPRAGKTPSA